MFGRNRRRAAAVSTAALMAALSTSHAAFAQEAAVRFTVPAQPLAAGLLSLGREAHLSIAARPCWSPARPGARSRASSRSGRR